MNHAQLQNVKIESLSHEGRGITHINNKISFIQGALPQEEITCRLTKQHSRYNEGHCIEVINPAATRVQPDCNHATLCGGCSLQHMDVTAQIQFKEKVLLEQLHHFGKVTPLEILPPLTGQSFHYRRKARLGVKFVKKKNKVLVGFREKSSSFLTEIESCSVLHPSVGTKINALRELIQSLTQFDQIPQIEVAVSDNATALVIRHMTPLPTTDVEKLCEFAKQQHFHLYLQPNPPEKIHKIWPPNSSEKLQYQITQSNRILTMQFHPLDFIQINGEINQRMIQQALSLLNLQQEESVLDLFCGLGNFTLPMSLLAKEVIGVEGSDEMVLRAKENAEFNQITNTQFYAVNLMEPSENALWMTRKYDKILLDPPRAGAKEIIPFFARFGAKTICYVSCNPATLARDAHELTHIHGYRLKKLGVINMFPHTTHIEAIALFEK